MEASGPRANDRLAVRSRVSWPTIDAVYQCRWRNGVTVAPLPRDLSARPKGRGWREVAAVSTEILTLERGHQ
jgi:hypothetical protein